MPSAHPHARSCRWRTGDSHAARLGRAQEERRLPPSQNRSGSYRSSSLLHHLDVGMIGGHERQDILARVDTDVAKDRPRRLQKPPDPVRNLMAVIASEGHDSDDSSNTAPTWLCFSVEPPDILLEAKH